MKLQETFQQKLEKEIGKKLKLRINENRSTMLSVKWEPGCTRVSMHKFFLKAPKNVMDSLTGYIRRKEREMSPEIKMFIEKSSQKLDYSHEVDKDKLEVQGTSYNLQKIMQDLNKQYFGNKLKLNITWFGHRHKKAKSRVTFGLYHDLLKLIKINRILDNPKYPDYIVSFVIYHEMLHHVCPPYVDETGVNRIHNNAFKAREMQFHEYDRAQEWIKKNINKFFSRMY